MGFEPKLCNDLNDLFRYIVLNYTQRKIIIVIME